MNRNEWNTYATYGYTYDVGNDQRSAGGVHHHQIRITRNGYYQTRILQANGWHENAGAVSPVNAERGEALLATAEQGEY